MWSALVLAAGHGTRLSPLTREIPKPLLPIGHEPLLARTLRVLHERGASRLVVNSHHLSEKISEFTSGYGLKVHVSHEPELRGTAGGIVAARELLGEGPVLLVNGDIYGEVPVRELLDGAGPGLRLAVAPRARGEGTVGLAADGSVVRLRGQITGEETSGGDYLGMALVGEAARRALPDDGCLVGDYAMPLLLGGGRVDTVLTPISFIDIGTPRDYQGANLAWFRAHPEDCVGSGAELAAGVTLRESVIGAGARVGGRGAVVRSVVLPGAVATAPLSDAIVLPSGQVVSLS